jgi:general secretion pathway protein D
MRTRLIVIAASLMMPLVAPAQFDWGFGSGGGQQSSNSKPWTEFRLPNTRMRLDFRNANIDMVISMYSRTSGITIVKDPALTGPISITSPNQVTIEEAFEILNANLSLRGYDLRKEGNMLVIRQRRQDNRGGGQGGGWNGGNNMPFDISQITQMFTDGGSNIQLKVYQLKFANATQVSRVVNEVFAGSQNPMDQLTQMLSGFMGGQQNQQAGRGNFANRFGGRMPFNMGGRGQANQVVRASSDDFSNSVIVNAPSREQTQVQDLIRQLDKQTEQPQQPRVFRLEFASAEEVQPIVQNVLISNAPRGRGGAGATAVPFEQRFQAGARMGGNMQAAFGNVVSDPRTNSLVVTATEDNLNLVSQVIKELDQEVAYETNTFVIQLENARADQVAQLLNQAFGTRGGGQGLQRQGQAQNRTQQQPRMQQPRQQQNPRGGGGGFGGRVVDDGSALELELDEYGELMTSIDIEQGGAFAQVFGGAAARPQQRAGGAQGRDDQGRLVNVRDLAGQVTTIADPNTNSLIVVSSPENAALVRQILEQLDRIPEQVMIETMIVEATLDSSSKLGVEWRWTQEQAFGQQGVTGQAGQGFGLQNANPALQGFRYTLSGGNLDLFVNALKSDSRFQVLSTPRIFTSNNTQAQINISQSIPYVLSQREDQFGNITFNYAFQDVGIVLTVTPRITANGYVTMDVIQTANDLQGFTTFNAPIVNQRQANTTVSVRDGETIILGGIIRSSVSSTVRKIPLLGDIPLLGNLFRTTDKSQVKTELLVFLTPRIVRNEDEARRLREQQQQQLAPNTQRNIDRALPGTTPPPAERVRNGDGGN